MTFVASLCLNISKLSVALLQAGKTSRRHTLREATRTGQIHHHCIHSPREHALSPSDRIGRPASRQNARSRSVSAAARSPRGGRAGGEGGDSPRERGREAGTLHEVAQEKGPQVPFCVLGENEGWVCRARVLLCNGQPACSVLLGRDVPEPKGDRRAVKLVTAFPWRRGHVRTG